ncbi:MAG: hypothetical protein ACRCW9_06550 [Cetobacterium sp.]
MGEYEEIEFRNEYHNIKAFILKEYYQENKEVLENIKKNNFFELDLKDLIFNKLKRHLEIICINRKTIIKVKKRRDYCVIDEIEKLNKIRIHYGSPVHRTLLKIFNPNVDATDFHISQFLKDCYYSQIKVYNEVKGYRIFKDLLILECHSHLKFINTKKNDYDFELSYSQDREGFLNNYKFEKYNYRHEDSGFRMKGFFTFYSDSKKLEIHLGSPDYDNLETIKKITMKKSSIKINDSKEISSELLLKILEEGICYLGKNKELYNRSLLNIETKKLYLPFQEHITITGDTDFVSCKDYKNSKEFFLIIEPKDKKIYFLNKKRDLLLKTLDIDNTEENIKKISEKLRGFEFLLTDYFNSNEFYLISKGYDYFEYLNLNNFTIIKDKSVNRYNSEIPIKNFKTYLEELKRKILIEKLNNKG